MKLISLLPAQGRAGIPLHRTSPPQRRLLGSNGTLPPRPPRRLAPIRNDRLRVLLPKTGRRLWSRATARRTYAVYLFRRADPRHCRRPRRVR
jgi:hypothetical protein